MIGKAAMLISGINVRGVCEPLGVRFVVLDEHAGLVKAVRRSFIGAIRQRCQAHFMCNIPPEIEGPEI